MEGLEGHLWTQSFLRLISQSNDETKLRALQQIILHSQEKEQQSNNAAFNVKTKSQRKITFPKNSLTPMDPSKNNFLEISDNSKNNSPKIQKNTSPKTFRSSITPIMGKWALLTKYNKILKDNNNDADIVTKIVMEKFKNILNNYHKRTFMRKKTNEDNKEDVNFDTQDDNTSDPKSDPSESSKDITYQTMDPLWEEDEVFLENNKETLEEIISIHDQLLEEQNLEEETKNPGQIENLNLCDYEKLKEEARFEEKLHYDAQKFLEDALGDELYNYASVNISNQECGNSLPSEPHADAFSSVNTSQVSNLCRASTYLFNVLSGKNRKRINTNTSSAISYEELFTDNQSQSKASTLIREAAAQNQIILQTCKALNFCLSSKQFKSSKEYVEAEKILLLATLKYEAVKKELNKVEYCEVLKDLGQVTISNLIFPVGETPQQVEEFTQWCVGVVGCGGTVLATETVKAQEGDIRFEKLFNFDNLDVDFEITISIYSLYVKKGGHELKFHTKQETTTCPTPTKLINFRKVNKSPKNPADDYEPRQPSFILWGTCTIQIADLIKPDPLKLTRIPSNSILKGIVSANLSSGIELTGTYSGFLTIGSEVGGYSTWSRLWTQLNGFQLQYWNYPGEEEHSKPVGTIDLRFCVASQINQVDRELCARPRTLLLETGRLSAPRDENSLMVLSRSSYTITKHYLSADNHQELTKWQNKLNSVVSMLRNWNCMKCQLYFAK